MAVFVSPSRLDRIKQFFSRQVTDGEDPRKLFSLPVYLRKDGCVLRVGSIAQVEKKYFLNIFIQKNPILCFFFAIAFSFTAADVREK